jgi:hypothetical protein
MQVSADHMGDCIHFHQFGLIDGLFVWPIYCKIHIHLSEIVTSLTWQQLEIRTRLDLNTHHLSPFYLHVGSASRTSLWGHFIQKFTVRKDKPQIRSGRILMNSERSDHTYHDFIPHTSVFRVPSKQIKFCGIFHCKPYKGHH